MVLYVSILESLITGFNRTVVIAYHLLTMIFYKKCVSGNANSYLKTKICKATNHVSVRFPQIVFSLHIKHNLTLDDCILNYQIAITHYL